MLRSEIPKTIKDILRILFAGFSIFSFLSIMSYNPNDISWIISPANDPIYNITGIIGAYLVFSFRFLFGNGVWVIPFLFLFWSFNIVKLDIWLELLKESFGSLVFIAFSAGMCSLFSATDVTSMQAGGLAGYLLGSFFTDYFNVIGSFVIFSVLLVLSLAIATEFYFVVVFVSACKFMINIYHKLKEKLLASRYFSRKQADIRGRKKNTEHRIQKAEEDFGEEEKEYEEEFYEPEEDVSPRRVIVKRRTPKIEHRAPKKNKKSKVIPFGKMALPPLNLLDYAEEGAGNDDDDDVEALSDILETTLLDFDIEAPVVQVNRGPIITVFEVQPAPGVKVNKITVLSDDIALALKAPSVRIVAPIPGKSVVGIEVPNANPEKVFIRDLLESEEYQESESKLTLALGKDVAGETVVSALDKMPHLLIAGSTGSGKTVCVNSLIVSMLYKSSPKDVKFMIIDPKMVEMTFYNDIPHLICPVITDTKKAAASLNWAVAEMEKRYELFAKVGVRNIVGYNKRMENMSPDTIATDENGEPEYPTKLPYIVIIVDELADLMMTASQDVEHAITRLAQLSRAIGIHIILATQRPSVNVITGVIKANFPCRIAFKVSSGIDSRTILDSKGGEALLGKGDMLFLPPGTSNMTRCQSGFLSDEEIKEVVDYLKQTGEPEFDEDIMKIGTTSTGMIDGDKDDLYDDAVKMVLETGQASASLLQRRMRIGYNRAARLIDAMEDKGIISGARGSKPREVLMSGSEYDDY